MPNDTTLKPSSKLTVSAGLIGQLTFSEPSVATKTVESGGAYDILGAASTALRVGTFASLLLANTAATGAYVRFGDSSVAAPSSIADGIYLPPNSLTALASGTATHIRASAATVGVYRLQDSLATVKAAPNPPSPPPLPQPDDH